MLHSGPDVPGVTNHFGAWNAFLPLSLPCGLWGQRNWVITWAPSFISFVLTDDFLFLPSLSFSGYKECNVKMKQRKMMSYRNYLAQCLEHTVKTFSTTALLTFREG